MPFVSKPYNREELEKRLFNRRLINEETGCWLWTGAKDRGGYGMCWFYPMQRAITVHRIAAILWMGFEPEKVLIWDENFVLHVPTCSNKHCFNPEHLYIGSAQDNADDRVTVGNHHRLDGARKLSDDQVRQIRALRSENVRCQDIAEKFGVTAMVVSRIARGITYSNVKEG